MTDTEHEQAGVLTAAAVREKTFSTTRFKPGYHEEEVDNFLDEIEHTLTVLHAENSSLRDQLTRGSSGGAVASGSGSAVASPQSPGVAPGTSEMEEMLRRTLLLAQRTADQAVAEAREQAESSLAESRQEAQRLLSEARARAQVMELEATTRSTAQLEEADAQRRVAETRVEALRAFEREYRSRLRTYFEMQLQELEAGDVTTGAVAPEPVLVPDPVMVPEPVLVSEPSWGSDASDADPSPADPPAAGQVGGLTDEVPSSERRYVPGDVAQPSNLPPLAPPALPVTFQRPVREQDPAAELAEFAAQRFPATDPSTDPPQPSDPSP